MKERDMGQEKYYRVTAKAPCRISLFGGGTDVPPYCKEYGGRVMNFAINAYNRVEVRPSIDNPIGAQAMRASGLKQGDASVFVWPCAKGGGLGSSASMAVAMLGALRRYKGFQVDRHQIAWDAYRLETEGLGWYGGCQDQFAAAYGGFNVMDIGTEVTIHQLPRQSIEPFLDWLVLMDTGWKHSSYKIQAGFQDLTQEKITALDNLKTYVGVAERMLATQDYRGLGELLDDNWRQKKLSSPQSTTAEIDELYGTAKNCGAVGGKILGAGGGGHFLFAVPPVQREWFVTRMEAHGLSPRRFGIDYNGLEVKCGE